MLIQQQQRLIPTSAQLLHHLRPLNSDLDTATSPVYNYHKQTSKRANSKAPFKALQPDNQQYELHHTRCTVLLLKRRHRRTISMSCAWNGRRKWSSACHNSRQHRPALNQHAQSFCHQCRHETAAQTASTMSIHKPAHNTENKRHKNSCSAHSTPTKQHITQRHKTAAQTASTMSIHKPAHNTRDNFICRCYLHSFFINLNHIS